MTKAAFRKAFERLDTVEQAEVLGQLAAAFAGTLADIDRQGNLVFDRRRHLESEAIPLDEVRRRLASKKRRLA